MDGPFAESVLSDRPFHTTIVLCLHFREQDILILSGDVSDSYVLPFYVHAIMLLVKWSRQALRGHLSLYFIRQIIISMSLRNWWWYAPHYCSSQFEVFNHRQLHQGTSAWHFTITKYIMISPLTTSVRGIMTAQTGKNWRALDCTTFQLASQKLGHRTRCFRHGICSPPILRFLCWLQCVQLARQHRGYGSDMYSIMQLNTEIDQYTQNRLLLW